MTMTKALTDEMHHKERWTHTCDNRARKKNCVGKVLPERGISGQVPLNARSSRLGNATSFPYHPSLSSLHQKQYLGEVSSFGNDAACRGEHAGREGIGKGKGSVINTTARLLLFDPLCHKQSRGDEEVFRSTVGNVEFWLTLRESATDSAVKDSQKSFPGSHGGGGSAIWSYEVIV